MKKFLILLSGLVSIVFVLIVAAVIYLANLDPNAHKDWIVERFREETGRSLSLDGDIGLTLYPWLGLELQDVAIGNPEGFSPEEPFLRSNYARLRVRLLPLLDREYEIDTVELRGTAVNLVVNEAGQANWTGFGGGDAAPGSANEAPGDGGLPFNRLVLGGVDIRDAALSYTDRRSGRRYTLENLDVSSDALAYGDPIDLRVTFDAGASQPQLTGRAEIDATLVYDIDNRRYSIAPLRMTGELSGAVIPGGSTPVNLETALNLDLGADTLALENLSLETLDSSLQADVRGSGFSGDAASWNASITAGGSDLALLFTIAGNDELAARIGSLESRAFNASATAAADLGTGTATLSELEAELLGATVSGNLAATDVNSDQPAFEGRITAAGPDLPTLMEVLGRLQGGDSALARYGARFQSLEARAFNIDAGFDANPAAGNVDVPRLNAELLGFTVNGELNARDMRRADGSLQGSLSVAGDSLGGLLSALGRDDLAGIADSLRLTLRAGGNRGLVTIDTLDLVLNQSGADTDTIELSATSAINLDEQRLNIDNLRFSTLETTLTGNVSVTGFRDDPQIAGNLASEPFNPRRLASRFNVSLPATRDPQALARLAASATFEASASHLNLDDFTVTLDDSTIEGSAAVSDFNAPAIEFDVNVDTIDLDRYANAETEGAAPAPGGESTLPVDMLQALNIDGTLNIARLSVVNLSMNDVELGLTAADGRLSLTPARAGLYEGAFDGALTLDVSGARPVFDIDSTLSGVSVGPLSSDLIGATYLSGSGNIDLELRAEGDDRDSIAGSLDGSAAINLSDGVFSGVDVGRVLAQIETMIRRQQLMEVERGEQTAFDNFSASIDITDGVATTDDLLIEAPGFRITGQGMLANLLNSMIDFDLVASVDRSTATVDSEVYEIGGYDLPIACTGTIGTPRCLPATDQILRQALSNVVERELGDFIQRTLGGPGEGESGDQAESGADESGNESEQEQSQQSPEEELINRALDRLFR